MKNFIVLILIVISSSSFYAQSSPEEMVEKFFEKYKTEGSTTALNYLYSKNDWVSQSSDDVILLKNQMEALKEDYVGKYYGYELILEKNLSDSYVLKSYLVKYGRQPLRFTFQFYKPNDVWVFHGFSYDANLIEEVKEAAKLYNFRLH
ncbi:hypothetical protein ACFS5M_08620 [Lacinutrix iliipiscaria]|uniref:DUF4878 domain-containing protein n=1 Tax=Lacinutrix iliipiscaria TaxID=1230532 RepID=A0ABW5WP83_9FLAO